MEASGKMLLWWKLLIVPLWCKKILQPSNERMCAASSEVTHTGWCSWQLCSVVAGALQPIRMSTRPLCRCLKQDACVHRARFKCLRCPVCFLAARETVSCCAAAVHSSRSECGHSYHTPPSCFPRHDVSAGLCQSAHLWRSTSPRTECWCGACGTMRRL